MCNIAGHKLICFVVSFLVIIGSLNLGLTGLGDLLGSDMNVLMMLLGSWPTLMSVLYLLIGLSAVMLGVGFLKYGKDCACNK